MEIQQYQRILIAINVMQKEYFILFFKTDIY